MHVRNTIQTDVNMQN